MHCTVCTHPQRREIDQALLAGGQTFEALHHLYGPSLSALWRHKQHLQKKISQVQNRVESSLHLARFLKLNMFLETSVQALQNAHAEGNTRLVLLAIREGTRIIRLLEKIPLRFDDVTTYRLLHHPQGFTQAQDLPSDPQLLATCQQGLAHFLNIPCPELDDDELDDDEDDEFDDEFDDDELDENEDDDEEEEDWDEDDVFSPADAEEDGDFGLTADHWDDSDDAAGDRRAPDPIDPPAAPWEDDWSPSPTDGKAEHAAPPYPPLPCRRPPSPPWQFRAKPARNYRKISASGRNKNNKFSILSREKNISAKRPPCRRLSLGPPPRPRQPGLGPPRTSPTVWFLPPRPPGARGG